MQERIQNFLMSLTPKITLENAPEREMIGITAEKVKKFETLDAFVVSLRGQTFFEEYLSKVPVKKKMQKE